MLIFLLALGLRCWRVPHVPPGTYWDETALGYDAYSLLKTGRDHRGNGWPLTWIESYKDYKPPLYVYAAISFVAIFGLTPMAIRLPSVLAGSLTVLAIYLLVRKVAGKEKYLAEMAAFILAINPTAIMFSRAGFEVNLAVLLVTAGVLFFVKGKEKFVYLATSAVFFGLSLYAYHGAKIFTPLLMMVLVMMDIQRIWQDKKRIFAYIIFGLLFLVLYFPLLKAIGQPESQLRFQETSAFATLDPIVDSNQEKTADGSSLTARLWHHRYLKYWQIFKTNYVKHFDLGYLFIRGDSNPRHSLGLFGQFYHWELVTMIVGLGISLLLRRKTWIFLWPIILAPLGAAITQAAPHALRTLFSVPFYAVFSARGILGIKGYMGKLTIPPAKYVIRAVLALCIGADIILTMNYYFCAYPVVSSDSWQYPYRPLFEYLSQVSNNYNQITITNKYGRAYMYYLFYGRVDPVFAQQEIMLQKQLADIPVIGKYHFGESDSLPSPHSLTVAAETITGKNAIKTINFLDGRGAFWVYEN